MPDKDSPFSAPQVQDRRTKPAGILPKNTQALVLGGLAFLMVAAISLSGRNTAKERRPPVPPQTTTVVDPNAARIKEYQARVEEQARKLQLEQAQLARTQQALGVPSGAVPAGASYPSQGSSPYAQPGFMRYTGTEPNAGRDSIQVEMRKREYESLFASNVALSYRKGVGAGTSESSPTSAEAFAKAPPLYGYPAAGTMPEPPHFAFRSPISPSPREEVASAESGLNGEDGESVGLSRGQAKYDAELNRAEGKSYRLFEGTVFETVLTNRLDGYFSGPVNCMLTTNVYSHDGQRLLIPQGSRVLGEVRRLDNFGQQRLAVFFHRLVMPDGYSVSLDKFQGLNQIGETGLMDQVNHHYLQIFGVSLAIGAIAGLAQVNSHSGIDASATDAYRQGVEGSLSQSSLRILDRYLNVLPTVTIREGHRVKVYLSGGDLLVPAYEKHQMPSDL